MSKRFPWHLVILLGSGFALAKACKVNNDNLLIPLVSLLNKVKENHGDRQINKQKTNNKIQLYHHEEPVIIFVPNTKPFPRESQIYNYAVDSQLFKEQFFSSWEVYLLLYFQIVCHCNNVTWHSADLKILKGICLI